MAKRRSLAENWGQLGPAMRALPSNRWRAFVEFYLLEEPGHGAQAAAARKAGFGRSASKPSTMARIASRLMRDERVVAALAEESKKIVRGGAPEASKALLALVRDPSHKDHARAIGMVLARTDPEVTRNDINVNHRIIDPDQEAVEELRALRELGTSREKLLELFGPNGLERLEAQELVRRSDEARVINPVPEAAHGPE
jgi:phage terminase small subunit